VPSPVPTEDNFGSCWHKVTGLVTCEVRRKRCNSPEFTLDGGTSNTQWRPKGFVDNGAGGTGCCRCANGCNHTLETGTCNPDHYADSEPKKLRYPTMAPTTPSAVPTYEPTVRPSYSLPPTVDPLSPTAQGPTVAPTYATEPPSPVPVPVPTMTFVATDENLACDHSHDANIGITTATDGTCAVHLYLHHRDVFEQMYGVSPIGRWDTSQVTDMSHLFENELDFNEDISGWNVDAVTSMHDMFLHAESFDQDLGWCVEEACPAIDDAAETYEEYKARIAPLQAGCDGAGGQPCCVDMTDTFFYAPCILNDPPCGVKSTEGACKPTPAPTTAAPTVSAAPTLAPTLSMAPTSEPSPAPSMHPTGAPTFAPTMDWTSFCETKNETAACAAEAGCHWLAPYSRCIPECSFGIDNRDACDTRYCSWRWTPKLPISGKCLDCDAARKYETCDCGDASWGSAASRQTRQSGRRNLKFGYVELNTGFVVEGSVELAGVSLADAEAHAADITQTIIDVAGGVRPADATSCPGWACSVENQYCPQGLVGSTDSDYCCVFDEAGSGTWTAGACAPGFDDITVILSEPSARRRLQSQNQGADEVLVEYQIQVPEGSDDIADVWADALSMAPAKYPADATGCKGWYCSTEQQYCPQGLPGSKWSDFCCTDGRWTKGDCDRPHVGWRNALDARVLAKSDHDCSAAADPAAVGDGKCDAANNVAPCYDGGDCCEATCSGTNCGTYSYSYAYDCVNTLAEAGRNVTEVGAAAVTTKKDYCNDYCGKYWTCLDG